MITKRSEWPTTVLANLGKWGSGGTPKSTERSYYGGNIPWIRSGDLPDGMIHRHEATITDEGLKNSSAKWVPANAVLVALYGATIGKLGITTYPVTTNQAVAYCVPDESLVTPEFLFWYLLSCRPDLIARAQGGAQPNISQAILKTYPITLPPLDEQRRIVRKLGVLLTRSGSAKQELLRIPSLGQRYKQAVLVRALHGDLTTGWRIENQDAESPKFQSFGFELPVKSAPRNGQPDRGDEHAGCLPDRWQDAPIEAVGDVILGRQRSPEHHTGPNMRPYVRAANITWGGWDLTDVKSMNFDAKDFATFKLRVGDVLV